MVREKTRKRLKTSFPRTLNLVVRNGKASIRCDNIRNSIGHHIDSAKYATVLLRNQLEKAPDSDQKDRVVRQLFLLGDLIESSRLRIGYDINRILADAQERDDQALKKTQGTTQEQPKKTPATPKKPTAKTPIKLPIVPKSVPGKPKELQKNSEKQKH